jgi:hypothetical protein
LSKLLFHLSLGKFRCLFAEGRPPRAARRTPSCQCLAPLAHQTPYGLLWDRNVLDVLQLSRVPAAFKVQNKSTAAQDTASQ